MAIDMAQYSIDMVAQYSNFGGNVSAHACIVAYNFYWDLFLLCRKNIYQNLVKTFPAKLN